MAVVTVPDTQPASSPKAYATELFNTWGIGKQGVDNGVLFLISKGDRRTEVETGYGIEGILPDAKVGQILREEVTPLFKVGDFNGGIVTGTQVMSSVLRGETFSPPSPLSRVGRYTDWIFSGFGICLSAFIGVLSWSVRGNLMQSQNAFKIEPVGRTEIDSLQVSDGYLMWLVRWMAGERSLFEGKETSTQDSLALNLPGNYVQTWRFTFWAALILGIIFLIFSRTQVLILPVLLLTWLMGEIWLSLKSQVLNPVNPYDVQNEAQLEAPNRFQMWAAKFGWILGGSVLGLILILTVLQLLGLYLSPVILAASYGAFAAVLRLKRSIRKRQTLLCCQCEQPMERVDSSTVRSQLSHVERVTWMIRSSLYEGWHCSTCHPANTGLDLHLFSCAVKPSRFEHCEDCDALTVTRSTKTLEFATTTSTGKREISTHCASCEKETSEIKVIPKKSRSSYSSSSSSSYGGSYSSGSSSSYSSSDSGGGSFGGGESGGGGAGESW